VSTGDVELPIYGAFPATGPDADEAGVLGPLPTVLRRHVRLEQRLARFGPGAAIYDALAWLLEAAGVSPRLDWPEILWRAAGLGRPGAIAQLSWPRFGTRIGLGFETTVAHAVVDRLLGFDRLPAEGRLQITPVEWGVLGLVVARTLARLGERPGPLGPWDLTLERLGPEPFPVEGLGAMVTLRWPVAIGAVTGSVRLWVPEVLVFPILATAPPPPPDLDATAAAARFGDLTSVWRARAGTVAMLRGLKRLRVGGVLPIDGSTLQGTPQSPSGPVDLACRDRDGRSWFDTRPVPDSAGARLTIVSRLHREPLIREAIAVNPPEIPETSVAAATSPVDVPVTLTVELGRVSLTLRRVADLMPGDVLELARHAREPVDLTSGGRLIARGELVQIDTELGVRVTNVFL
jgi:flagellar motor switch protein FliN